MMLPRAFADEWIDLSIGNNMFAVSYRYNIILMMDTCRID